MAADSGRILIRHVVAGVRTVVITAALLAAVAVGAREAFAGALSIPAEQVALVPVAEGLSSPLGLTGAGDGSGRLFVIEQTGAIRIVDGSGVHPTPFLDLGPAGEDLIVYGGERGLLGLAFDPDYSANGLFFVDYTRKADGATVVARYHVSADPDVADPTSSAQVLVIPQPNTNHNGGHLVFGPDGYLYVGTGDGGGAGDPNESGQRLDTLLGKILRLDVNPGPGYTIPLDNPFVGIGGALGEIWAYGLRNPWQFSFDRLTDDLFIGDVGQGAREEIDFQLAASAGGENYGWDVLEGSLCYEDTPPGSCAALLGGGSVLPILEYGHVGGACAVTGGFRYRGSTRATLAGQYLFGDYCNGIVWRAQPSGGTWSATELFATPYNVAGFGEDDDGKLYLLHLGGSVLRITPYTFSDVPPSGFAWRYVESVAGAGVTAGCGATPAVYCPEAPVSRAQMAVFVLKSLEGPGWTPPPCTGVFADVPCPSLFADWIEEFAARGITAGCGGGVYCPDDPTSRAQMAVFLLKGVEGAAYVPPACTGIFADVSCPSQFADWVEELAARGITAGCGDGLFCPGDATSRAQMAVFLTKAFGLPVATP